MGEARDPAAADTNDGAALRGGHWTPVADADADLIANSQTPQDFTLALGCWYVLLREASYRRALTFVLGNGLLAKRIGASIKTTVKACRILSALGLLKSTAHRFPGSKLNYPCERTIYPAVMPWRSAEKTESVETAERCAITAERCATHRPPKTPRILQTSSRGLGKKCPSTRPAPALGGPAGRSGPSCTAPAKQLPVDAMPPTYTGPWKCVGHEKMGSYEVAILVGRNGEQSKSFDGVWKVGEER